MIKAFKLSNNKLPFYLGGLLCLYYLLPRELSISLEFLLLIGCLSKRWPRKINSIYPIIWYLLFFIFLFLVNFNVSDQGANYISTCINCFIFVIISNYCIRDEKDVDSFVFSFSFFGAVFCAFLIPLILFSINVGGARIGDAGGANGNTFLSSSINIGYMTSLICVCQYRCLQNEALSKKLRFLFLSLFIFSFFCILMSGTRKALFSTIICIVFYSFYIRRTKIWKLIPYAILLCFGFYALYQLTLQVDFLYLGIGRRLEGVMGIFDPTYAEVDASTLERERLLKDGFRIFKDNILFGAGVDGTQRILNDASHPHNNFLSCLDFGGLVVFLLYYSIYICSLLNYFKKITLNKLDIFAVGVLVAILFTDYFATTYNIILFPSFLVILFLQSKFKPITFKINA